MTIIRNVVLVLVALVALVVPSAMQAGTSSDTMIITVDSSQEVFAWGKVVTFRELEDHLPRAESGGGKLDVYLRGDKGVRFEVISHLLDVFLQSGRSTINFGSPPIRFNIIPIALPEGPTIAAKIASKTTWSGSRPNTIRVKLDFDGSPGVNGVFQEGIPLEQVLRRFPRKSTVLITGNKLSKYGLVLKAVRDARNCGFKDIIVVSSDE